MFQLSSHNIFVEPHQLVPTFAQPLNHLQQKQSYKSLKKTPSISTVKTNSPALKHNYHILSESVNKSLGKEAHAFQKSVKKYVDFDTIVKIEQTQSEVTPFTSFAKNPEEPPKALAEKSSLAKVSAPVVKIEQRQLAQRQSQKQQLLRNYLTTKVAVDTKSLGREKSQQSNKGSWQTKSLNNSKPRLAQSVFCSDAKPAVSRNPSVQKKTITQLLQSNELKSTIETR